MTHSHPIAPRQGALPKNNPEAIAKHAIRVVEKAIKDRFGLDVHGGIELEYGLFVPNSLDRNPVRTLLNGDKDRGYATAIDKQTHNFNLCSITKSGDSLFPKSTFVCYSYPEIGESADNNGLWKKHETVISHLGSHNEVTMGKGRFVALARATEALRRTIARPSPPSRIRASNITHQDMLRQLNESIQDRVTDATMPATNGLHLNLSLSRSVKDSEEDEYRHEMLTPSLNFGKDPTDLLKQPMADIWNEAAFLHCPTTASRERTHRRKETSDLLGINMNRLPHRIEIMRPSSSSNPYYVCLVGLLSIYHMLDTAGYNRNTNSYDAIKVNSDLDKDGKVINSLSLPNYSSRYDKELPETIYKNHNTIKRIFSDRFFNGEHLIRDILDGIEDGLGTRFEDAIKRTPPGTEKSNEAAGIVSYEDILARRAASQQSPSASRA